MAETVTCTYDSSATVVNAKEDLVASGIPQENIYVDEKAHQLKVMIPAATRREVVEILNRHHPTQQA